MLKTLMEVSAQIRGALAQRLARKRIADHERQERKRLLPPAILDFWREHGRHWAQNEASPDDLACVVGLFRRAKGPGGARLVRKEFEKMWLAGFRSEGERVAWTVIPTIVPDAAYCAFAEGAAQATNARAAAKT